MRARLALLLACLSLLVPVGPARAAKTQSGPVYAWGRGIHGQIGSPSYANSSVPYPVANLQNAVAVSGGATYSLALASDGSIWGWGNNQFAQLGNGSIDSTQFGSVTPSRTLNLSRVTAVSAGGYHALALKKGLVWSWGDNALGQLGRPSSETCSSDTCSSVPASVPGLRMIRAISAGGFHSLALKMDGTVVAWGYNIQGQLGDGTTSNSPTPVPVTGLTDVVAISAGNARSSALRSDGTVWVWGEGTGSTPQPALDIPGVVAIADNIALKSDGTVWYVSSYASAFQVAGLANIKAIAAGGYASLALRPDGVVFAWGGNFYGGFGNGTTLESSTPVQTSGLWRAIGAGTYHSLGVSLEAPPAAPAITSPANGSTQTSNPVTLTGTALPATTVIVNEGNTVLGSTVADASGNWSLGITFPNGTHEIVARAQRPNGNMSNPSAPVSFTVSVS